MGWAFLFVVAAMLVWLFVESGKTRLIAFGVIAFFAAVGLVFFYVLDAPERRQADAPEGGADVSETAAQRAKIERSRTVLTPASIAMTGAALEPQREVSWGSDGKEHVRENLFAWTFRAQVKNLSTEFAVKDMFVRVRLFSCPSFFSMPAAEVVIDDLERRCALIGDRTTGFYGIDVAQGASYQLEEAIEFDNQPEPRNWRFWAGVSRVDAVIE